VSRTETIVEGDRGGPAASGPPVGIVITLLRGGCEVVHNSELLELRLVGRHAHREIALAVGDEVTFDGNQGIVLDVLTRRTKLARRRPRDDPRHEHVIAANMDRLAVITSVVEPPFRPGVVDRFLLAAFAGGLEGLLVVNKIDLLEGAPIPEQVRVFDSVVPICRVSARTGEGLEALRAHLVRSRTVFAGHSGVGKSSLLNGLQPDLRLETGGLTRRQGKGRHTTAGAVLLRLPGDALVVDTPGIREVATGPVDPRLLDRVYPDVSRFASGCKFWDCRHDREPECAVREAVSQGELPVLRHESYQKLVSEIRNES
jgi:ribosome biogenesis GTPase